MDDFTGNQYWQPKPGSPIDPANHPATSIPDATEHHDGTVLPTESQRSEGKNRLRTQFQQSDSKAWQDAAGRDAQNISSLVRGRD